MCSKNILLTILSMKDWIIVSNQLNNPVINEILEIQLKNFNQKSFNCKV